MATRKNFSAADSADLIKENAELNSQMLDGTSSSNNFEQDPSENNHPPPERHLMEEGGNTNSRQDYTLEINNLVENLKRENYLPVVFVGAAGSGKTQVFTSLLSLFQKLSDIRNPNGVNVTFGPPLVDMGSSYGRLIRDNAERHFREVVSQAMSGVAEEKTLIDFPFAIPVHLEAKVDGVHVQQKFAFFETNGEWFHPDLLKKDGSYYRQLKPEIQAILRQYDDNMGVVFLYTAPSDLTSSSEDVIDNQEYLKRLRRADESLQVGMNRYLECRARKDHDTHIFLLTKWDAAKKIQGFSDRINTSDYDQSKLLTAPNVEIISLASEVVNNLYPGSYGLFNSASLVSNDSQRVFLPYCAGLFNGKYINTASDSSKLDRFAKSLWNQLMRASGYEVIIFPSPPKQEVPFWRRIINMLTG